MALPPGPRVSGIIGLLLWMADPVASFETQFRRYGDMYTLNNPLFGREVVVSHPELIEQIFAGDPDVFHAGEANQVLGPVVGQSTLTLDGKEHRRRRKLLSPPLHGKRLGIYADVMHAITRQVVADWPRGERFALLESMQRITLDVIVDTVFGVRDDDTIDLLRTRLGALMKKAQSPLGMIWMLPAMQRLELLSNRYGPKRETEAADEVIFEIIRRARESHSDGDTDILAMLLSAVDEDGHPMTDLELRDELTTLLLAGHETTATALCWAVEEIMRRPDVLARIRAELDDADSDEPWRDKLPYLDATIKEVLRLRPIAPLIARKLTAPIELREFEIPAGIYVVPNIYIAQRHPDFWDEPDVFRPQRFLDNKPNPYAWLPFGGGTRRCIGMAFALFEMRVVLATILTEVELHVRDEPPRVQLRSFTFAPNGGAPVIVEDRAG